MSPNLPPQPSNGGGSPVPAKKTSPLVWILIGVAGFVVFIVVAMVGLGFYAAHKIRQAGDHPGVAVAKLMTAMNPDVEIVSTDEDKGLITLREKKTGKTITVDLDDVKNGKITFQDDKGETVSLEASGGEHNGSLKVKSSDGTVALGAGSSRAPAWIPVYPGSSPQGVISADKAAEHSGLYSFKTKDSVAKVAAYYEEALKAAGFRIEQQTMSADGGILNAGNGPRKIGLLLASDAGQTSVNVTFSEKR
jgi:hypothetical protein